MKPNQIMKQAVDFQKSAFTNWCSAVEMIQGQFTSAMETMMSQTDLFMPEEGRKAVKGWTHACQEEFKRFHGYVEDGLANLEKHLAQEVATPPTKAPATPVVEAKKPVDAAKSSPVAK